MAIGEEPDTVGKQNTPFHGGPLLVVPAHNADDVTLEFRVIAYRIGIGLLGDFLVEKNAAVYAYTASVRFVYEWFVVQSDRIQSLMEPSRREPPRMMGQEGASLIWMDWAIRLNGFRCLLTGLVLTVACSSCVILVCHLRSR